MKYNKEAFDNAVHSYKKMFEPHKGQTIFVEFSKENKGAFLSLAPLSRAPHELGCDVSCTGYGEEKEALEAVKEVWKAHDEGNESLQEYISQVKGKIEDFDRIFARPDVELVAGDNSFEGTLSVPFDTEWFVAYREEDLEETGAILWKDVYNILPEERVGIGFETIATDDMLGHPLEDYLDSYAITWAMVQSCPGKPTLSGSSSRDSMLKPMERVGDLRATLLGCEYDKEISEEPFISFKKVSEDLNLSRIKPGDASFSVHGKGYPGKHAFGDAIGYPSPNGKTKWKSPGQMIFKLDFYPQTKDEERDPQSRVAFTETLPIDVFIETNLLDWSDVRAKNQKVKDVLDKCDVVFVKGKLDEGHVTDLEVGLVKPDGTHRWVRRSDTDVREKLNKEYLERTGIRAGCMGNIPGGEAFVTPEYVKGKFVGDVVIAIDQSYPLNAKDPFVVECSGNEYKILTAPKDVLAKFEGKKKEAWELLLESEKNKSLPEEIIKMKKDNFNNIGEFAINTNTKAKLCDYLIVNEKIAKMMHIALGSGYEEDRSTDYHIDIVFDAPRQKLDVFGKDGEGNEHWILRDGEFVA